MKKLILLCIICGFASGIAIAQDKTINYPNGDKYVGQVNNKGEPHGYGTLIYNEMIHTDGKKYAGQWKDGEPHGEGTAIENGIEIVGQFKDGRLHGQVTMIFPDGIKFVGQWEDGGNSKGTLIWPNGRKYVGEVEFDYHNAIKPHGQGTLYYSNGEVHQQGTFEYGKYVGK
ncbi:MAG: hypothetical protein FWG13_06115 [Leptospirales bacterium]|nr:hypothetical protein [Leptospirales bacterium]